MAGPWPSSRRGRLRAGRLPRGGRLAACRSSPRPCSTTSTPSPTRCAGSPATAARSAMVADRRGLLPARPGGRARPRGCCSPTSPPPTSGSSPRSAVDFLGLPDARGRGRPGARRRPRPARRPRACTRMDMGVLLDDFDLYPDEMLSDVARRLGFGELVRRRRRPHLRVSRDLTPGPGSARRCAPPSTRRAPRWRPATYPIGAVVLDAGRRGGRPRPQRARGATATRPATPRSSRCARPPRPRGRVAARRLHPGRHPRAVHDVRRRAPCWPGWTAWSSARTTTRPARSVSCGTWSATGGSTTVPRWSAGVLAEESTALLDEFFEGQRPDRPGLRVRGGPGARVRHDEPCSKGGEGGSAVS